MQIKPLMLSVGMVAGVTLIGLTLVGVFGARASVNRVATVGWFEGLDNAF